MNVLTKKAGFIQENDPSIPEYLDFDKLRKEGLKHIAAFSGDIWTDHNVHDPGITILEILCYALTDLGYRNTLKVEDIFARGKEYENTQEDNFFTANEILTCNPLTITDYRKLLMDIEGVRNAWLEVAPHSNPSIYLDENGNTTLNSDSDQNPTLMLNGLYNVYIEIDDTAGQKKEVVRNKVNETLNAHRNLGEDFASVQILEEDVIVLGGDIQIAPNADPEMTLVEIYKRVREFISPQLQFYSLQELLGKGKTIEEIYAGRPLTLDSHGFIDTEELLKFERKCELHVSDFYEFILEVEGVKAIRSLTLAFYHKGKFENESQWLLTLDPKKSPVFSPKKSRINLFKGIVPVPVNESRVHLAIEEKLANYRKVKTSEKTALDTTVPKGQYRADLAEYFSIQNEFPRTYRIGKGELLKSDTPERRAQTYQLQGYLLFYDQLLANYLAQLGSLRNLYSFRPDSDRKTEENRSYFVQPLHDFANSSKIIPFYKSSVLDHGANEVEVIASSSKRYPSKSSRDYAINTLVNGFASNKFELVIDSLEGGGGYKFAYLGYLNNNQGKPIKLVESIETYKEEKDAIDAGSIMPFIASDRNSYIEENLSFEKVFTFKIKYDPSVYLQFLQNIAENPHEYQERRNRFLDHLLGRFAEEFTDYVLLMYALNGKKYDLPRIIEDKANFLSNYPSISRNRAKGHNYSLVDEQWNTDNVSGLESKVNRLMGIRDVERRSLNNFSIVPRQKFHHFVFRDFFNNPLLISRTGEVDEKKAIAAGENIRNQAKHKSNYQTDDCYPESVFGFSLLSRKIVAIHSNRYSTTKRRDEQMEAVISAFNRNGLIGREVSEPQGFKFEVYDEDNQLILRSKHQYDTEFEARNAFDKFMHLPNKADAFVDIYDDDESGFNHSFAVKYDNRIIALAPQYYEDEELRDEDKVWALEQVLADEPKNRVLNIVVKQVKDNWHFELLWDVGNGYYEPGLIEAGRHSSREAARNSFNRFISNFENNSRLSRVIQNGLYSFELLDTSSGNTVAKSPNNFSTEETCNQFLQKMEDYLINHTAPRLTAIDRFVTNPAKEAQNVANEFWGYQLEKRDIPFAFHPGEYAKSQAFTTLEKLIEYGELKRYQFTQIYLDEEQIIQTGDGYRYRLKDKGTDEVLWLSIDSYSSREKAKEAFLKDFLKIIELARNNENYWVDPGTGEIQLREDQCGYAVAYVFSDQSTGAAINERIEHALKYPFFKEEKKYSFSIINHEKVEPGNYLWLSGIAYDSFEEVQSAFFDFLVMLEYRGNYELDLVNDAAITGSNDNDQPVFRIIFREVLIESCCKGMAKEEAWYELNNNFLKHAEEDYAIYPFVDYDNHCDFGFRIVDDQYRLVQYIGFFETREEQQAVRDALFAEVNDTIYERSKIKIVVVGVSDQEGREEVAIDEKGELINNQLSSPFYIEISNYTVGNNASETVVWKSLRTYNTLFEADQERVKVGLGIMLNARDVDFYRVVNNEIILVNEFEIPIAKHENFASGTLPEKISKLIQFARKYPVTSFGEKFEFQYYNFAVEEEEDFFSSSAEEFPNVNTMGKIIFESINQYDSPEAAEKAFDELCYALKDKANYQAYEPDPCGPLSLEIVNPVTKLPNEQGANGKEVEIHHVLAIHPRVYKQRNLLNRAIDRTKALINVEGFHLIEHLLLRPKVIKEDVVFPNCPDLGTAFQIHEKFEIFDDCQGGRATNGGEITYIPGADPYSCWVTVVVPFWPSRFQNLSFRDFFENTLRKELPAHIAVRIAWVDPEQMDAFEKYYRTFLLKLSRLKENSSQSELDVFTEAQEDLINSINSLKNVYPEPSAQEDDGGGMLVLGKVII